MKRHKLTQREFRIVEFYTGCSLAMSPKKFKKKWNLSYEEIAWICGRSRSTVSFWFATGKSYSRRPTSKDLRHLAMVDFLFENFEEVPAEFLKKLCPRNRD